MIVTCPSCETKFEIPDDKYRPGRKARCSNCTNVFVLPDLDEADLQGEAASVPDFDIPTPSASAASADYASSAASGETEMENDALVDSPPTPQQASTITEETTEQAVEDSTAEESEPPDSPESPASPASVDDIVPPEQKSKPSRKLNRKNLLLILGVFLVVALLGYGGVMVYSAFFASPPTTDPTRATDGKVVESLGGQTIQTDQEIETARQAAVRRLALEGVRQYTVSDNESNGPMVVVEGTVVNNFDAPKDLILLEVTLFDRRGNALVLREQYCGITLTPLQLRTFTKAAIENALADQSNIIINNTDIPPGGRVPFTTVFFNLPKSAYEFEVKIVDVQEPAPQPQSSGH